jgi:hypothetical protein
MELKKKILLPDHHSEPPINGHLTTAQFLLDELSGRHIRSESDHANWLVLIIEKHLSIGRQPMSGSVGLVPNELSLVAFRTIFDKIRCTVLPRMSIILWCRFCGRSAVSRLVRRAQQIRVPALTHVRATRCKPIVYPRTGRLMLVRLCTKVRNPTHGSAGLFQIRPTKKRGVKSIRIPTNGSWWIVG